MDPFLNKSLAPGSVLAIALRDPRTGATLLAAGTVLTPRLIRLLRDMGVASEAALCLGTTWQRQDFQLSGDAARGISNAPVSHPQLAIRKRLHQSMASLRALLGTAAVGAGAFGWLVGSRTDVEAAIVAVMFLGAAFVASYALAGRSKAVLAAPQHKRTSELDPSSRLVPFEAAPGAEALAA